MRQQWSKDEVLQAYLNIIYFGRSAYGISAASQAYFNKPVEQLTVSEGALLAALIQRPSTLDPAVDLDGATGPVELGARRHGHHRRAVHSKNAPSRSSRPTVPPDEAKTANLTTGPNGLIERQVIKELLDLFNIDQQTLNTQGLQITTTIDPQAQKAAVDAVGNYLDGQMPEMRAAVVSIDPRTGGVKAYYGGSDAPGFDFAQAGLPTGSSFKVFALVAALEQGMGLGYQVDSSPLKVDEKLTINNSEGDELRHLQHRRGAQAVAQHRLLPADAEAARTDRRTWPTPRTAPVSPRASPVSSTPSPRTAWAAPRDPAWCSASTRRASSTWRRRTPPWRTPGSTTARTSCRRSSTPSGEVLFDAAAEDNTGERRIEKAVADNVTAAMQPIPGWSNGHNLSGGRPSAAKTGTHQLGDTGANRDAWMVGYTPSLSTAVWVGTVKGDKPLVNSGADRSTVAGLPADIWKATMDGALQGTDFESFPTPTEVGGYAGVPAPPPPPPAPGAAPPTPDTCRRRRRTGVEVLPGITIPFPPPPPGLPSLPPPGHRSRRRRRLRRRRPAPERRPGRPHRRRRR